MLRHMCPPLGLGKRCPARVAYKVRKDPIVSRVSHWCRDRGGGVAGFPRGARDFSAQRGVTFSVIVPLVLFLFPFSWKVGVGWSVLWRCVMVWV